jgi:hypothetical protein
MIGIGLKQGSVGRGRGVWLQGVADTVQNGHFSPTNSVACKQTKPSLFLFSARGTVGLIRRQSIQPFWPRSSMRRPEMASTYAKRLAKLEELLAAQTNKPLAIIWIEEGESREDACVKKGVDPSLAHRCVFVRWKTSEETVISPPAYPWDQVVEAGPPDEEAKEVQVEPVSSPPTREPDPEAENRYRLAIEQREREIVNEKLQEGYERFARSIV